MHSNQSTALPHLSQLSSPPTSDMSSSTKSSSASRSWNDAPLEALIAEETLLHNMSMEELSEFVKRCAVLRSSAQSRKAALNADGPKKKKGPSVNNIDKALELLAKYQHQKEQENAT